MEVKQEQQKLRDARDAYARSDFEKLFASHLPDEHEDVPITRIYSYKIPSGQMESINTIRTQLKNLSDNDNDDGYWKDNKKLNAQTHPNAEFECDMYLKFGPTQNRSLTFGALFGEITEGSVLCLNNNDQPRAVQDTVLHNINVWVEVCVKPHHARHKVLQLMRAKIALGNDHRRVIAAVCLNGKKRDVEDVVNRLKASEQIQGFSTDDFRIVFLWMKERNMALWLKKLDKKVTGIQNWLSFLTVVTIFGFCFVWFHMDSRFKQIDMRFEQIDMQLKAIMERLDRGPVPWGVMFRQIASLLKGTLMEY